MEKRAENEHPLHEIIAKRWSPRVFNAQSLDVSQLMSLMEAARWAASCFNEQPWSFLVALRSDEVQFKKMLACLVPGNQEWAKGAGALVLGLAATQFKRNGNPNRYHGHDLGLATAQMVLQAEAMGLRCHAMAGILGDKIRADYGLPDEIVPLTAVAVGYPLAADRIDAEWLEREQAQRVRKPLSEMVFCGRWAEPFTGH